METLYTYKALNSTESAYKALNNKGDFAYKALNSTESALKALNNKETLNINQ